MPKETLEADAADVYLCGLRVLLAMLTPEQLERFRVIWYSEIYTGPRPADPHQT